MVTGPLETSTEMPSLVLFVTVLAVIEPDPPSWQTPVSLQWYPLTTMPHPVLELTVLLDTVVRRPQKKMPLPERETSLPDTVVATAPGSTEMPCERKPVMALSVTAFPSPADTRTPVPAVPS